LVGREAGWEGAQKRFGWSGRRGSERAGMRVRWRRAGGESEKRKRMGERRVLDGIALQMKMRRHSL